MLFMKRIAGIIILVLSTFFLSSQSNVNLAEELLYHGDAMINTLEPTSRIRAAAQFDKYFRMYLDDKTQVTDTEFLKFTKHLVAPDEKFTLITWQVQRDSFQYDFSGYLITSEDKIFELKRTGKLDPEAAYQTSTNEDWYGCLYYSIKKLENNKYLLFGKDPSSQYDNQKLIDPITINENEIVFGHPIIEDKESLGTFLNRLVISYSSDASVNLNYNKGLDVIIQDHLEARIGLQAGQGATYVPDGTYEGYYLEDGKWLYKEKLYDHVYEDAPRPKPVFNSDTKQK